MRAHSPAQIVRPVAPITPYAPPLQNQSRPTPKPGTPAFVRFHSRRVAREAADREAKRKGYDLDRVLANNKHDVTIMDVEHATKVWRDQQRTAGKTESEIDRYWGEILQQTGHKKQDGPR